MRVLGFGAVLGLATVIGCASTPVTGSPSVGTTPRPVAGSEETTRERGPSPRGASDGIVVEPTADAPSPSAPARAEPVAADESTGDIPGIHPSVAALCTEFLNRAQANRDDLGLAAESMGAKLGAPACATEPLAVSFARDATYRGIQALRVSDGLASRSILVARLADGFAATTVTWRWEDPTDPGCPSVARPLGLESVFVQNGHLVALVDANQATYVDESPDQMRETLVRTAAWCKPGSSGLRCKTHGPPEQPALGWKLQPRAAGKQVAWALLPWKDARPFSVGEDGELRIAELAPHAE